MTKEIVYTDKYALILSDEIPTKVYYDTYIHQLKHTGGAEYGESSIAKTVIGHLPLTDDAPILEGVPLLPPLPQGEEKYKFTRLDMIKAFKTGARGQEFKDHFAEIWDEFVEFIDNPSRPTHFECEMEEIIPQDFSFGLHGNDEPPTELLPKTTTNSQGQLELVGKYFTKN
jgi:hypothetical protein